MNARCWALSAIGLIVAAAFATPAAAQEPAPQPAAGSFLVEEIRSGFVVAPDYKFTEVDGRSAGLLGVRGGLVTDRRLFVGGAGYWLPDTREGLEMWYGGGLVEWFANPDGLLDFSVSGLVGAGTARLPYPVTSFGPRWYPFLRPWFEHRSYRQAFFLAEPQASVHVNLKDWLRVGGGAGYRFVGAAGEANGRLSGFTASIGVQIGPP